MDLASQTELLRRLNEAQAVAHIGSWNWDVDTQALWWSDELYRIFDVVAGSSPTSVEAVLEFIHPDDRAVHRADVAHMLEHGHNLDSQFKIVTGNGVVKHCHFRGRLERDPSGRPVRFCGTLHDITESKRAEAALRDSDERFRQLAASLPQLVWTCRADGWCDYLNPRWVEYTGEPAESQLGYRWLDHVHPDDRDRVSREWDAAQVDRRPTRTEFRIRGANDTYRWFDTRSEPLLDDTGNIVRWVGSNTDIDDRRRAEEAQLRTQKMEALGTLAGGIAHDFNNMLLAIAGNAQLAIEDLPEGHPSRTSVVEIQKASARASELVRRVLAFSRHEEPKQEIIQLQPVIEEALKLARVSLPAKIELNSQFAADLPNVNADATQVHQAIVNLTTNAAYAIGTKVGRIEVHLDAVHIDDAASRRLDGLRAGPYVRLTVSDDGCGMDKKTQSRIFDPFFTTKPHGEGTGLGLSVVDGIMKRHSGMIRVYGEANHGTTFELYFPSTDRDRDLQVASDARPQPIKGARIVYVDDDEALVILCERFLDKRGHHATCFNDPAVALAHIARHLQEFDALVTDLAMPKMSGFELARAVLALRPDLPIIIMSGYVTPNDQEVAAQIGIRAVLLKPSSVDDLSHLVDLTLREQRAFDHTFSS